MICPDRCTMELWGTYQGIKINQVYRCKWCTVTSYRSVEMDYHDKIMNIQAPSSRIEPDVTSDRSYAIGHRVARHAAAELAAEADEHIAEMAVENAELREQLAAKDAELGRAKSALSHIAGTPFDLPNCRTAKEAAIWMRNRAELALASPAGELEPGFYNCKFTNAGDTNGFVVEAQPAPATEPLVTSDMKRRFIGEFYWDEEAPYYDENGDLHADYVARHVVPWDLCKRIYKEMATAAAPVAQSQECALAACAICNKENDSTSVEYDGDQVHQQCALNDQDSIGMDADYD